MLQIFGDVGKTVYLYNRKLIRKQNKIMKSLRTFVSIVLTLLPWCVRGQQVPVMETGANHMPDAWIDRDTGHKVIKLTRRAGDNTSFYFHNNPFIGNEMLFAGSSGYGTRDSQMFAVDLSTLRIRQVTKEPYPVRTEIACAATHEIFFQHGDSVFAVNTDNGIRRCITRLEAKSGHGAINCVNCDGTLLAGVFSTAEEEQLFRDHPNRHEWFNMLTDHPYERTLFTIDTRTGRVNRFYSEVAWLNHLQFSPCDPHLLMFCHEGQWHRVDRIWNIDVTKPKARLMHRRTMENEIAGHEWFGALGRHIYFDLQKPRSENFFIGRVDLGTGAEQDFRISRDEWSVHFTTSWDERFIVGDGGSPTSVAHSDKNQWIFRFDYDGDRMKTTKLVNMKHHDYALEPNVHFSPDGKWIIFRANFEGHTDVYAVEL